MYECCPICYWEDDGQDDEDADVVRGGPNASLSLLEARETIVVMEHAKSGFVGTYGNPIPVNC